MQSRSRVVEALQGSESNMRAVLAAVGCDPGQSLAENKNIRCPMPGHEDKKASCTVSVDKALMHCKGCGEGITMMGLLVAHGRASDHAEAARLLEDILRLPPDPDWRPSPLPSKIDDPSASVDQYLALKNLSPETRDRFGLQDVQVFIAPDDSGNQVFEKGWYTSILLPVDSPASVPAQYACRPRVRTGVGPRWATMVRFASGEKISYSVKEDDAALCDPHTNLKHFQRAYGIAQYAPSDDPRLAKTIIVVEGESDIHALHDMGITCALGMPGATCGPGPIRDIARTILSAEDGDPAFMPRWNVVVWQEPGLAGSKFPAYIIRRTQEYVIEAFLTQEEREMPDEHRYRLAQRFMPRIIPLPASKVLTPQGASVKDPCEMISVLMSARGRSAAAQDAGSIITDAVFVACGKAPEEIDAAAPEASVAPSSAPLPKPDSLRGGGDPWAYALDSEGGIAPPDYLPPSMFDDVESFSRTERGWEHTRFTENGPKTNHVCTPFWVSAMLLIGDRRHVEIRYPDLAASGISVENIPLDKTGSDQSLRTALAGIGVIIEPRQAPYVGLLMQRMVKRCEEKGEIRVIPTKNGWVGIPGHSEFAGIDAQPANEFAAKMFHANEERRGRVENQVAALKWWNDAALPLLTPPAHDIDNPLPPDSAAPALAIGAAAAAPLIAVLAGIGVRVSPVIWLAGLGGGGKTITQKVCASIFAPDSAGIDGQVPFFANANISPAALNARVGCCRDLPLILDDVTQLMPVSGTKSRGDEAKIEAAAELGLLIFNQKPIERATREGEMRPANYFRSTAIFSAEVSMTSKEAKRVLKAGSRRRITCIEACPMSDRGLGPDYAHQVNMVSASSGGAAGEMLIAEIRRRCEASEIKDLYYECRRNIQGIGGSIVSTQVDSLAVSAMGFSLLVSVVTGASFDEALHLFVLQVSPFVIPLIETGNRQISDDDLCGVDDAIERVKTLIATYPKRFERLKYDSFYERNMPGMPDPSEHLHGSVSILGKEMDLRGKYRKNGFRGIVLLDDAMDMLARRGVSETVVKECARRGKAIISHRCPLRSGEAPRGVLWYIPIEEDDDQDDDNPPEDPAPAPEPHNPDPQNLAAPPSPPVPQDEDQLPSEPDHHQDDDRSCDPSNHVEPDDKVAGEVHAPNPTPTHPEPAAPPNPPETTPENPPENPPDPLNYIPMSDRPGRIISVEQGDYVVSATFIWKTGLYAAPPTRELSDYDLRAAIRSDALADFDALRHIYESRDDLHVPVPDLPAPEDPNWEKIDALHPDVARGQWLKLDDIMEESLKHPPASPERTECHARFVRHYRISIMCRLRRPELFVTREKE